MLNPTCSPTARTARSLIAAVVFMATGCAWGQQFVTGEFQTVLNTRSESLTIWQMAENPNVYVFDFPGLSFQGRSFNRITQFTEQQTTEPYPKVLSNAELSRFIEAARRTQADFAFGHDVLVSELVQFFNYATRDKVELNQEEIFIRDFLTEQGLIRFWRGFYQAMRPDVVLLSIPQPQPRQASEPVVTVGARHAILLHELAHGEYYTNSHYQKFCQRFWYETLTEGQKIGRAHV